MSFSSENGYSAATIEAIMNDIRQRINAQFGTSYTAESFVGTNFYKYFYALAQRLQENEVKTSEIFSYLQQYFAVTNERIQRPVATAPGVIEALEKEGYVASVKKALEADAGKIFICVQADDGLEFAEVVIGDITFKAVEPGVEGNSLAVVLADTATAGSETVSVASGVVTIGIESGVSTAQQIKDALEADDEASLLINATIASGEESTAQNSATETSLADGSGTGYPAAKAEIGELIKNSVAGGIVTQGDQVENIVLSNGQDFDFKYSLPNRIELDLRLTIHTSDNNQVLIEAPEIVKNRLLANINEHYRLGKDFEPQKYFSNEDAPWAATVLLEWSEDGGSNYFSTVYEADFDDLFIVGLENILLVES